MKKRALILLVVLIPLSSVCMGVLMLTLAFGKPSDVLQTDQVPLSKTSWRTDS